jgi:hypothetical protein
MEKYRNSVPPIRFHPADMHRSILPPSERIEEIRVTGSLEVRPTKVPRTNELGSQEPNNPSTSTRNMDVQNQPPEAFPNGLQFHCVLLGQTALQNPIKFCQCERRRLSEEKKAQQRLLGSARGIER